MIRLRLFKVSMICSITCESIYCKIGCNTYVQFATRPKCNLEFKDAYKRITTLISSNIAPGKLQEYSLLQSLLRLSRVQPASIQQACGEMCHYKRLSQISFSFSPFFCITAIGQCKIWVFCVRHGQPTRLKNCGKYVAQKLGLGAKPLAGFFVFTSCWSISLVSLVSLVCCTLWGCSACSCMVSNVVLVRNTCLFPKMGPKMASRWPYLSQTLVFIFNLDPPGTWSIMRVMWYLRISSTRLQKPSSGLIGGLYHVTILTIQAFELLFQNHTLETQLELGLSSVRWGQGQQVEGLKWLGQGGRFEAQAPSNQVKNYKQTQR